MSMQPHDRLVRWAFAHPETAAAAFRGVLPPALVARVRWSSLQQISGTFVDPTETNRHSDLLFSARLRRGEEPLLLYLLFEHQSGPDRWMAVRMARYALRAQDRWLSQSPRARKLPWVIPLVLYHGRSRWTAATDYRDLLALPALPEAELLAPTFPYRLLDLSQVCEQDLRLDALGLLVTRLLRHAWERDLWARLPQWGPVLAQVFEQRGLRALEAVFRYITEVSDARPGEEVRRWIAVSLGPAAEESMKSWAQQERDEGRQEGRKEGRQELFVQVLRRRFGSLSADLEARVLRAGPADLDRWLDGLFNASSPDELLRA